MATNLQLQARQAVKEWCESIGVSSPEISMLYPRAYIVGRYDKERMIVAVPWQDAPRRRWEVVRECSCVEVTSFHPDLGVGEWCVVAQVYANRTYFKVATVIGPAP